MSSDDDSSSEPEDESMMDPLAEPSTTYRSLKKGVIREGPEVTSDKVGNLAAGELFEVLEERVMGDGSA
jgi:hypothetical protein